MKITSQEEYGLRCLLQIARANGESLTIPEIAASEGLSAAYVGKLLAILRHAGLIDSVRGRSGGYRLAAPAAEIGLSRVLKALGEPLYGAPSFCERHAGSETDGECVHLSGCTLRTLWLTLEHWIGQLLDQITLADLIQNEDDLAEVLRTRLSEILNSQTAPLLSLKLTN
ncbi:MAG: hypothetical protein KatS3mg105_4463 [Gemmatales bacterium]|nr:MAG: hypothetical protein KatS3mg105_4463 [Gemmatales bacterium]